MKRLVIAILMVISSAACFGGKAPVSTSPTAEQVQATRAKAVQMAQAVESAGNLVVQAGRSAVTAYNLKLITAAQRDVVLQAIIDLEPKAHAAIDIAAVVTTEPQLRSTMAALMAVMDPLLTSLSQGSPEMAQVATAIRAAYQIVILYVGGA